MKLIKAKNAFFVLLMVFSLSSQLVASAEEKFSISKDRKSAKAIVSASKEFTVTFDPPLASKIEEYDSDNGRIFFLTAGSSCKMKIFAQKGKMNGQDEIGLRITDSSGKVFPTLNNPTSFKVSASNGVEFDGLKPICKNNIKFEPYPADTSKFLVDLSLEGDIPQSLGLKSEDASFYLDPSESNNKEVLPIWAWIIIALGAGILVLILLITAIAIPVCLIKRRKKKTAQKSSDPTLQTATEKAKSKDGATTASVESKEHAAVKQAIAFQMSQQVKPIFIPRGYNPFSKENAQTTQEPNDMEDKPYWDHSSDCFMCDKSIKTVKKEIAEIRERTPPELFDEKKYKCTC